MEKKSEIEICKSFLIYIYSFVLKRNFIAELRGNFSYHSFKDNM